MIKISEAIVVKSGNVTKSYVDKNLSLKAEKVHYHTFEDIVASESKWKYVAPDYSSISTNDIGSLIEVGGRFAVAGKEYVFGISDKNGENWNFKVISKPTAYGAQGYLAKGQNNRILFATNGNGVRKIFYSDDFGDTWNQASCSTDDVFAGIAMDSERGIGFTIGQRGKMHKTIDNGLTWKSINQISGITSFSSNLTAFKYLSSYFFIANRSENTYVYYLDTRSESDLSNNTWRAITNISEEIWGINDIASNGSDFIFCEFSKIHKVSEIQDGEVFKTTISLSYSLANNCVNYRDNHYIGCKSDSSKAIYGHSEDGLIWEFEKDISENSFIPKYLAFSENVEIILSTKFFLVKNDCQGKTLPIERGGTGAVNISDARENLDVYSKSEINEKIRYKLPEIPSVDTIYTLKSINGILQWINSD